MKLWIAKAIQAFRLGQLGLSDGTVMDLSMRLNAEMNRNLNLRRRAVQAQARVTLLESPINLIQKTLEEEY